MLTLIQNPGLILTFVCSQALRLSVLRVLGIDVHVYKNGSILYMEKAVSLNSRLTSLLLACEHLKRTGDDANEPGAKEQCIVLAHPYEIDKPWQILSECYRPSQMCTGCIGARPQDVEDICRNLTP